MSIYIYIFPGEKYNTFLFIRLPPVAPTAPSVDPPEQRCWGARWLQSGRVRGGWLRWRGWRRDLWSGWPASGLVNICLDLTRGGYRIELLLMYCLTFPWAIDSGSFYRQCCGAEMYVFSAPEPAPCSSSSQIQYFHLKLFYIPLVPCSYLWTMEVEISFSCLHTI